MSRYVLEQAPYFYRYGPCRQLIQTPLRFGVEQFANRGPVSYLSPVNYAIPTLELSPFKLR